MERVRTIEQAVAAIRQNDSETALTEWAVRQLVNDGKLPYLAVGKKKLISLETLEKYLENCLTSL